MDRRSKLLNRLNTWTSRPSMKPTIDKCVENIQKTFIKLKWLRAGNTITTTVLRTCFFVYSFPHFAWLFPLLPKTHQETLRRKFRVGIRLVHRCQYIPEHIRAASLLWWPALTCPPGRSGDRPRLNFEVLSWPASNRKLQYQVNRPN